MSLAKYLSLGDKIKYFREHKGFTQKEMATRLGIATSTYYNYESNNREPNMFMLEKIADIFEVSLVDILNANPIASNEQNELIRSDLYYKIAELTAINSEDEILEALHDVIDHRKQGLITTTNLNQIADQVEFIIDKILSSRHKIELSNILSLKASFNMLPSMYEKYHEYSIIELVDKFNKVLWSMDIDEYKDESKITVSEIIKCLGLEYVLQIIENQEAYIDVFLSIESILDNMQYQMYKAFSQRNLP